MDLELRDFRLCPGLKCPGNHLVGRDHLGVGGVSHRCEQRSSGATTRCNDPAAAANSYRAEHLVHLSIQDRTNGKPHLRANGLKPCMRA